MLMTYPPPKLDPKSGRWRARKVVPTALRERIGKGEFVKWLGTDRLAARTANAEFHAELEARFASLSGGVTVLTRKHALALAGRWYQWFITRHEDDPGTDPEGWRLSLEQLQDLEPSAGIMDDRTLSATEDKPRGPRTTQRVHAYLHDRGRLSEFFFDESVSLAPTSLPLFMEALEEEFYAAHRRLMQLAEGNYAKDTHPERFPEWQRPASPSVAKPARNIGDVLTLIDLFERWKAARPEIKPGTLKVYTPAVRSLDAFVEGKDARDIIEDDVWKWLQHQQDNGLSKKSVRDNSLTAIKSVMGWAASYPGGRLLPQNPSANVRMQVPKRAREREPNFRADEIKAILGAALAVPDDPKYPARAFARRWVPWLCAYTGARVQEMTQLRGADVRCENGVWVLDIQPDAGTVKSGSARRAFLHEHLVALGFPTFAASRGSGPLFYDPTRRLKADAKSTQAELTAKDLALWVKATVQLDPRLQPNHAWRHTFKTRLQEAHVEPGIRDILVGHAASSVARSYEHASPALLAAEVNKVPRYKAE